MAKMRKSQNPSESRAPEMGLKLKNRIALWVGPRLFRKIGLPNALKNRAPCRALPGSSASNWYESRRGRGASDLGMMGRKFQHSQSS